MRECRRLVEVGRRQFLKGSGIATASAVASAVVPREPARATPAPARITYPSNRLANIAELEIDQPLDIAYPDDDSPGVLLKLGRAVEGGAGLDGDIVAFSTLCPHKGFPLLYDQSDRVFNCPGHYSRFDAEKGGLQVWGQATQPAAVHPAGRRSGRHLCRGGRRADLRAAQQRALSDCVVGQGVCHDR